MGAPKRRSNRPVKAAPIGTTYDSWNMEELASMDDAFTAAMEKEHRPRRRRSIDDFTRDIERLKRARGTP